MTTPVTLGRARAIFITTLCRAGAPFASTLRSAGGYFASLTLAVLALPLLFWPLMAQPAELSLAVLPFSDTDTGRGSILTEAYTTELVKTGRFLVYERAQVKKILTEAAFQESGLVEPGDAVRLARLAGVKYVVYGSVRKGDFGLLSLSVTFAEVETGRIRHAVRADGAAGIQFTAMAAGHVKDMVRTLEATGVLTGSSAAGVAEAQATPAETRGARLPAPATTTRGDQHSPDQGTTATGSHGVVPGTPNQVTETSTSLLPFTPFQFAVAGPASLFPPKWSVIGLSIGLFYSENLNLFGIGVNPIASVFKDRAIGIQASGIFNSARSLVGLQYALVNVVDKSPFGLQVGGVNIARTSFVGLQVGGIYQGTKTLYGAQVGFINNAKVLYGVQIGFINVAGELHGLQVGLVNVSGKNGLPFLPIVNMGF